MRSPHRALTAVQPRDGPAGDDEDVRRPEFGQPHEEVAHDGEDVDHQHGLHPAGTQHGSALRPRHRRRIEPAGKGQRGHAAGGQSGCLKHVIGPGESLSRNLPLALVTGKGGVGKCCSLISGLSAQRCNKISDKLFRVLISQSSGMLGAAFWRFEGFFIVLGKAA